MSIHTNSERTVRKLKQSNIRSDPTRKQSLQHVKKMFILKLYTWNITSIDTNVAQSFSTNYSCSSINNIFKKKQNDKITKSNTKNRHLWKRTNLQGLSFQSDEALRGPAPPTAGSHYKLQWREASQRERSGTSARSRCAAWSPGTCRWSTWSTSTLALIIGQKHDKFITHILQSYLSTAI